MRFDPNDIEHWHKWYSNYIAPLFNPSTVSSYYEMLAQKKPTFYPDKSIAYTTFNALKHDFRFDTELKHFFSFLTACRFFDRYNISFEEWIVSPNWQNPSNHENPNVSIVELLEQPNGHEALKKKLRWLPFLDRPEGS